MVHPLSTLLVLITSQAGRSSQGTSTCAWYLIATGRREMQLVDLAQSRVVLLVGDPVIGKAGWRPSFSPVTTSMFLL